VRRASHRPFLAAFDDERVVPCVLQGPGQAQTGDATACDYYPESRLVVRCSACGHDVLRLICALIKFYVAEAGAIIGNYYRNRRGRLPMSKLQGSRPMWVTGDMDLRKVGNGRKSEPVTDVVT
jgi:hypothetical protein